MKKITRKKLEEFLSRYASDNKTLDVGSGGSSYNRFFPNRLTLDVDPERKPEIVADVHNLPFDDNTFQLILCTEVLEHCLDPQKAISEMMRALRPSGRLILTTRFVYPLHDTPHDYYRFTEYGLRNLFSGWEIEELIAETRSFSAVGALLQRLGFQSRLRGGKFTKSFIYLIAWMFTLLDFLIVEEYGNIKRTQPAKDIFTTGYYIVVLKR